MRVSGLAQDPELDGTEEGATNSLVTGRDIQAAERALQAAKDARLPPDLVASLCASVRDLRRRAELEKPHERRLATARRRTQRTGDRLEQITAKIIELEAARAKLAADYREAEAYAQQLQQAAGDGNQAAGVQAARTLIRDLSQIGTIPAEIATLLMDALTAPPPPPVAHHYRHQHRGRRVRTHTSGAAVAAAMAEIGTAA